MRSRSSPPRFARLLFSAPAGSFSSTSVSSRPRYPTECSRRVSFRFPGGPREERDFFATRLSLRARDCVYYHFPYNGNLSVNSDAHVSLIFAYIMEYYVFFPPRASHFSPLTDRPEVLCNGLCENTPRLRR